MKKSFTSSPMLTAWNVTGLTNLLALADAADAESEQRVGRQLPEKDTLFPKDWEPPATPMRRQLRLHLEALDAPKLEELFALSATGQADLGGTGISSSTLRTLRAGAKGRSDLAQYLGDKPLGRYVRIALGILEIRLENDAEYEL